MKLPCRHVWSRMARQVICLPMLFLAGCVPASYRLFHPNGPIANLELQSTIIDVAVMLVIILPVAVLICVFMWRYRKSANAAYDPHWSHSLTLEILVWAVPLITVCVLAFFSYETTLAVNPYGPAVLGRADAAAPKMRMASVAPAMPGMVMQTPDPSPAGPLQIDVITTDWQWFFIYPQLHIATIDELVVPQGRDVEFHMTSATVVNDFFVPELVPMMDVMPGMQTVDMFRAKNTGTYKGFSADFSGAGFAWMQFAARVVTPQTMPDGCHRLRLLRITCPMPSLSVWRRQRSISAPNRPIFRRFRMVCLLMSMMRSATGRSIRFPTI